MLDLLIAEGSYGFWFFNVSENVGSNLIVFVRIAVNY